MMRGPILSAYLAQGSPEIHAHRAFIEVDRREVPTSLGTMRAKEAGNLELLLSNGLLFIEASFLGAVHPHVTILTVSVSMGDSVDDPEGRVCVFVDHWPA